MTQDDIPEAVASVTYSLIDPDGFPILFTVRDIDGLTLLKRMESVNRVLKEKCYKPQVRNYGGQKAPIRYAEGKVCPNCRAKMRISREGKEYCEALCWKK